MTCRFNNGRIVWQVRGRRVVFLSLTIELFDDLEVIQTSVIQIFPFRVLPTTFFIYNCVKGVKQCAQCILKKTVNILLVLWLGEMSQKDRTIRCNFLITDLNRIMVTISFTFTYCSFYTEDLPLGLNYCKFKSLGGLNFWSYTTKLCFHLTVQQIWSKLLKCHKK